MLINYTRKSSVKVMLAAGFIASFASAASGQSTINCKKCEYASNPPTCVYAGVPTRGAQAWQVCTVVHINASTNPNFPGGYVCTVALDCAGAIHASAGKDGEKELAQCSADHPLA